MIARIALLLAAVATLASVVAAPASAAGRCRPHKHEHVLATSARAVLVGFRAGPLYGCSRATGARRRIDEPNVDEFVAVGAAQLRGTRVVFIQNSGDHYGNGREQLILDSGLHAGRRVVVTQAYSFYQPAHLHDVRFDGTAIAWLDRTDGADTLHLWHLGDVTRAIDQGFSLSGVSLADGTLTWHRGGAARSVPTTRPDACPETGRARGTDEVDVLRGAGGAVVCWRASGALTPAGTDEPHVVIAGAWMAAWRANAPDVTVRDLVDGRARTIATPNAGAVVIDDAGSVVYTRSLPSASYLVQRTQVWADDSAGPRLLADADDYVSALVRDGPVVRWSYADRPPRVDQGVTLAP